MPEGLECSGSNCCFEHCAAQEVCGVREFTGCTVSLCGYEGAMPCLEDTLILPEWFFARPCVLYWVEGGIEMGYVAAAVSCLCQDQEGARAKDVMLMLEGNEGMCDLSEIEEPACDGEYVQCQ